VHALRQAAADWQLARGIRQWLRDDTTLETVAAQVAKGEWYVAELGGAIRGALRLLDSDPVWPQDGVPARYVHGLMTDRSHAGTGLGASLLAWAADQARQAGAEALRLDCIETNVRLRQYYSGQGFRPVGRFAHPAPWHSVVLWERTLA
jgi:GNAT superfamily N-acetyltransferase